MDMTWDRLGDQDSEPEITETQAAELDRRLAAYAPSPGDVVPWEVVKAKALARVSRLRLAERVREARSTHRARSR